MTRSAVDKAVREAGGQGALARAIGITTQAVHQWVKKGRVPAQRALAVEAAVGGKVTRHELRPDLYPHRTPIHGTEPWVARTSPGQPQRPPGKERNRT